VKAGVIAEAITKIGKAVKAAGRFIETRKYAFWVQGIRFVDQVRHPVVVDATSQVLLWG
jgi:hypothetical protein